MAKIKMLPKNIFELIAAGEVVERPSSVVKELLENSIDAGATTITVEIQSGGIRYIRVTDNGCGIARQDVPLAFQSHATSKISKAEDLDAIFTLGFRGEALSSIAAVSKAELITKTAEDFSGSSFIVEGGDQVSFDDVGCPNGTTIIIRNLFFNTPARMKFLKKDISEGNFVSEVVDKIAISHPEIGFRMIRDGKETLFTTGDGNLLMAVSSVFGKDFIKDIINVDCEINGLKIKGLISAPYNSRATRSMQNFFVNKRYIKNKTMLAAIEEAYKGSIMVGKHPSCVLFVEIPPESVDVNVHPSKIEVRFSDEKRIFDVVYQAVKNALNQNEQRPQININKLNSFTIKNDFSDSSKEQLKFSANEAYEEKVFNSTAVSRYLDTADEPSLINLPIIEESKAEIKNTSEIPLELSKDAVDFKIIGEAFKTYIFVECDKKLLIIDKHAAHERILYDKLKNEQGEKSYQLLLNPVNVTLSKEEYTVIMENIELLKSVGFDVEDFGIGSVLVRECPIDLTIEEVVDFISEISKYLIKNKRDLMPEKIDWVYHNIACRAAIKAGQYTTEYELNTFVKKLLNMPEIRFCPHGRPTIIELSKYDIEKQFGRIQ